MFLPAFGLDADAAAVYLKPACPIAVLPRRRSAACGAFWRGRFATLLEDPRPA
jgi:hypothetical protein